MCYRDCCIARRPCTALLQRLSQVRAKNNAFPIDSNAEGDWVESVGVLDQYSQNPKKAKFKNDPAEIQGRVIPSEMIPNTTSLFISFYASFLRVLRLRAVNVSAPGPINMSPG